MAVYTLWGNNKKNMLGVKHIIQVGSIKRCLPVFLAVVLGFGLNGLPSFAQTDDTSPTADPSATQQDIPDANTPPYILIEGKKVVSNKNKVALLQQEMLPESLQNEEIKDLLENRVKMRYFTHNPAQGPVDAPITLIEMTDLSCLQCMDTLRAVDDIMKKYKGIIRLVHMYLPVDMYNATNPAVFYGKVAQYEDKFWEYRKLAMETKESKEQDYAHMLVQSGIDASRTRQLIRERARNFYRELDADSALGRDLRLPNPPVLLINGIRLGGLIPVAHLEDIIKYELAIKGVR